MIIPTPELVAIGQRLESSTTAEEIVTLHGELFDWIHSHAEGRSHGTVYLALGLTMAALLDGSSMPLAERRIVVEAVAISAMAQLEPDAERGVSAIDLTGLAPAGEA